MRKEMTLPVRLIGVCTVVVAVLFGHSVSLSAEETPVPSEAAAGGSNEGAIAELREKIDERNRAIAALEEEISSYRTELEITGKEAQSLRATLRTLNIERKKLLAEMRVTENKVRQTELRLKELSFAIGEKEETIGRQSAALASSLRSLYEIESTTLLETLLSRPSLASAWDDLYAFERIEYALTEDLDELHALKDGLVSRQEETDKRKRELTGLRAELSDRKKIVESREREKNSLLAQTRNKEANYRRTLEEKVALRAAFERELREFEEELQLTIDPSHLPAARSGVLAWPLDEVRITQRFGNTAFAAANSGVYAGAGHNGIDLKASVGTKVKAALSGKVVGAGDTDTVCPGASYGKWVLIEHENGLSTLYAHLSLVRAGAGQNVATGEIIGYSGNTGYSTGPHLHFTVYATEGVRILTKKSKVCGGTYTMPIADLKAYLNPLSYL